MNTSDTEPAALDGRRDDGRPVVVHVSGPDPDSDVGVVVELRAPDGGRVGDGLAGETVTLPAGAVLRLRAGYPDRSVTSGSRLWRASCRSRAACPATSRPSGARSATATCARHGRCRTTGRSSRPGPPVSSAGPRCPAPRARCPGGCWTACGPAGLHVATITLHAGVSSPEADEVPLPERYRVPAATAAAVNATRAAGRRVVAVGTTVTRALETVAVAGRDRVRSGQPGGRTSCWARTARPAP